MGADDEAKRRAAKVEAWLRERWLKPGCSVCGEMRFDISSPIRLADAETITRASHEGEGAQIDVRPFITVTCRVCGHVMWFSAQILGIDS